MRVCMKVHIAAATSILGGRVSGLRASFNVFVLMVAGCVQRSRQSREPSLLPFFIFKYWWQFHMKWIFTSKRYKIDDSKERKNETAFVIWIFIIKKETVGATEWRGWWSSRVQTTLACYGYAISLLCGWVIYILKTSEYVILCARLWTVSFAAAAAQNKGLKRK